ncbi:DUF1501 domain-containing protein [Tundrisphaera sp. TA3]|uniref:DUF1501 domain-containing protein n=1 Tax=Tundrisphaera sp. TA3 TaxID=3435775 RepID=UPI003EBD4FF3
MIHLLGPRTSLCDGLNRREILRLGSLGLAGGGLSLAHLQAAGAGTRPDRSESGSSFGRAKSCIVLFLMGGPPQHSTWDPKPDAPAEIRGEFGPIATAVPGIRFGSILPGMAKVADKLCILRAVSTRDNAHSSSGYYMLTGNPHQPMNVENANPGAPNDWPGLGALVGQVSPARGTLPPAITLPHRISNTDGSVWPGQDAGFLGRASDPWLLNVKPGSAGGEAVAEIALPEGLGPDRVGRRRDLLDRLGHALEQIDRSPVGTAFDEHTRRAFGVLASAEARAAFQIDREDDATRDRYGRTPFGEGVLQARRMVEAGVRLVQVNWYRGVDEPPANPCWDSHANEASRLRDNLGPPMDRAFSALVEDLDRRGRLDETLVVCMAEFGRTPRIDANGGRGHWGPVFSIAMAGGGVRGGQVHGSSDKIGAYPKEGLVRPEDLAATIFHCLGHAPDSEYRDPLGRPLPLSRGEVIRAIL